MNSSSRNVLVLALVLATGCSSSTSGAGTSSGSGGLATSLVTCGDLGGTCSKLGVTASCATGTARVAEASSLCPTTTPDCCVPPPPAGTVQQVKGSALVCTSGGKYPALAGTCAGEACQLGCECSTAGCDCSRGLTPGSASHEVCAVLSCGVITCGAGCRCSDAATSTCSCP